MKSIMAIILVGVLVVYLTPFVTAAPLAQQQQSDGSVNVDQLIEEVKLTASEVGTASYVLYKYIVRLWIFKKAGYKF